MQIDQVLAQLRAERARIQTAIDALSPLVGAGKTAATRRGRPRRRVMSADARRKISEAQKKRWAARKKAA
jgi:outer membrane protein TolC